MREDMFKNELMPAVAPLGLECMPMHLRTLQPWIGQDCADVAARVEQLAHVTTQGSNPGQHAFRGGLLQDR